MNARIALALSGVIVGATTLAPAAEAQKVKVSDAEVQSNVLRDMAAEPRLASQQISTSTTFGIVTLSGSVNDDASRDLAEKVASHSKGVVKVVDQITVGGAPAPAPNGEDSRTAPVATPQVNMNQQPPAPQSDDAADQQAQDELDQRAQQELAPQQGQTPSNPQQTPGRLYRRDYERQQAQAGAQAGQDPQQQYSQQQYGQQQYAQPPYTQRPGSTQQGSTQQGQYQQQGNPGGVRVSIAPGTPVQVRLNRWLSSGRVQPGTTFDGFISNDVISDGQIALPRGATVQGTVLDVQRAGALAGRGSITLQLTSVTLGGQAFPLQSEPWTINGRDKTGNTVASTAFSGLFGALIGGAVGGGAGALAGAGIGGAAGLGISAASGGGNAVIPGEAKVDFRLSAQANVITVSDAEMARLGNYAGPAAAYPDGRVPVYGGVYPAPYYGPVYGGYGYGYPGVGIYYGRPYYGGYGRYYRGGYYRR